MPTVELCFRTQQYLFNVLAGIIWCHHQHLFEAQQHDTNNTWYIFGVVISTSSRPQQHYLFEETSSILMLLGPLIAFNDHQQRSACVKQSVVLVWCYTSVILLLLYRSSTYPRHPEFLFEAIISTQNNTNLSSVFVRGIISNWFRPASTHFEGISTTCWSSTPVLGRSISIIHL